MKTATILVSILILGLPISASAQEPVKDPDPATASPDGVGGEAVGGPDAFGYVFADTAEPICEYQFVDITATGTSIVSGDDTSSGPIALGLPLDFYGTLYTDLVMATNGYLSTDPTDTGPDLSSDCPLPSLPSSGGGGRLYPLHDDLITADGLVEFFPDCPRRGRASCPPPAPSESCTIFQWNGVTHFGGGGPWNMQAILYHSSSDVVFQVAAGNPETGAGSTTGIQDDGTTDGLTYACSSAGSVLDDTGVCFFHPFPAFPGCAPPIPIPAAGGAGLVVLLAALAAAAFLLLRRRRRVEAR